MKDMTFGEIAELCSVDERTVRRWAEIAAGEMPDILPVIENARKGSPARFSLPMALAMVRAGGKPTLAALLAENATKTLPAPKPRLPNGKQLEELRRLHEAKVLSPYQVQLVLGVAIPRTPGVPEVPATPEQANAAFAELRKRFPGALPAPGLPAGAVDKAVAAGAGAFRKTLDKLNRDAQASALQPELEPAS